MRITTFIKAYGFWHYTNGFLALLKNVGNTLTFFWRFFDIPRLLLHLFSPWHRLGEQYQRGDSASQRLATFVVNTLMRLVGAIVRAVVAAFGAAILVAALAVSIGVILVWAVLPLAFLVVVWVAIDTII